MSDGLSFDDDAAAPAPAPATVRCGVAVHQLFRGEVCPIEDLETHCLQALVMAGPFHEVSRTDTLLPGIDDHA